MSDLEVPEPGPNELTDKEIAIGERLVEDMAEIWNPDQDKDTSTNDLMARIESRIRSGETHAITPESNGGAEPRRRAEVIDLVSLLRRSSTMLEKAPTASR